MTIQEFIKQLEKKVAVAGAEDAKIASIGTGRDNTGDYRQYIVVNAETAYSDNIKVQYKIEIDIDE